MYHYILFFFFCFSIFFFFFFFFFNDTATTEIYTLSLHDALPISHIGGEHRQFALREVDGRSAAIDEHERDGEAGIDAARRQARSYLVKECLHGDEPLFDQWPR